MKFISGVWNLVDNPNCSSDSLSRFRSSFPPNLASVIRIKIILIMDQVNCSYMIVKAYLSVFEYHDDNLLPLKWDG